MNIKLFLQYDDKFKHIKFKNNTTLKAYGCCVMSTAMTIKYYLGDTIKDEDIVKEVVTTCTNQNGDFFYPTSFKVLNKEFSCLKITSEEIKNYISNNIPVVVRVKYANGGSHYVLCTEVGSTLDNYKILDPGYGTKTIGQLKAKFKDSFLSTIFVVKKKFNTEIINNTINGASYMHKIQKMLVNNKEVDFNIIFDKDKNFIELREFEKLGFKISYDNIKKLPIINIPKDYNF